jgi:perosamine synthetase
MNVPFFRPSITEAEIGEVANCLRSGWLTTGPMTKRFETEFATAVGGQYAIALNSCTAALHLALEALEVRPGDTILVPTMTFAATAEVVRYMGAMPILVDCDPVTFNMDLADAERKLSELATGKLPAQVGRSARVVGMIPVHVAGHMMDMQKVNAFAKRHNLWVIEDAAHAFPAAWRAGADTPWQRCGENSSLVTCYSFYANKTITTGEGGMAVTHDSQLADRMRMMSLHGLSRDAWDRYRGGASWDYRIIAPGFKYNLTDVAAAIGVHQLGRAETLRLEREEIAKRYRTDFAEIAALELPPICENRLHSWHLFPVQLRLEKLSIDRNAFMEKLKASGVGCSVHWRPLHLHPYYEENFGWLPAHLPTASSIWPRLVSLPLYPGMTDEEYSHVVTTVRGICLAHVR